jgi:hypothetical protein
MRGKPNAFPAADDMSFQKEYGTPLPFIDLRPGSSSPLDAKAQDEVVPAPFYSEAESKIHRLGSHRQSASATRGGVGGV